MLLLHISYSIQDIHTFTSVAYLLVSVSVGLAPSPFSSISPCLPQKPTLDNKNNRKQDNRQWYIVCAKCTCKWNLKVSHLQLLLPASHVHCLPGASLMTDEMSS